MWPTARPLGGPSALGEVRRSALSDQRVFLSPASRVSGRKQSEPGPVGSLVPPVGVISVPIPVLLSPASRGRCLRRRQRATLLSPGNRGRWARPSRPRPEGAPPGSSPPRSATPPDRPSPKHTMTDTAHPKRFVSPVPPPPLPTACMSRRTQSEHGPTRTLEPPVEVISVPIPCDSACHCDGERNALVITRSL